MRAPSDIPQIPRRASHRGRIVAVVVLVVLGVLLLSLRGLATFYTDYLWFGSIHLGSVWSRLLEVKAGLFGVFGLVFFVVAWINLAVVDRLAPQELLLGPEDELVRRYQSFLAPHAIIVRTVISLVLALIAASSAIGEWANWLLYSNSTPFDSSDPQFHKNISFFVFKLPFLNFLVSWSLFALVVITVVTVLAHYLNGGIRPQGDARRVAPQVKAHLSVLLAVIAVVKAFGYVLQKYDLDLSQNGYVQGAGYTDVKARIPALTLLALISVAAGVILMVNIRRKGWSLPVLAVGLWAFVAIVIGAVYPWAVQTLKVNPAQDNLESTYISRNISATRAAMGLDNIDVKSFSGSTSLTSSSLEADVSALTTLGNVKLWDPSQAATETNETYTKEQALRSYYSFNTLSVDRYEDNGQLTPEVVGARQINDSDLPAQGWVNTHLQYTHGYGMIVSPANSVTSGGQPTFDISNVPPQSKNGLPTVKQPSVYFGLSNPNGGDSNYVVANTQQPEIDYQTTSGNNVETHYTGSGGVQLGSFITRAAFALRFWDYNLLVSDLITPKSRIMFVRDIQQIATKSAPFLSLDSDPYPVLVGGQIEWVQDAYTTTDNYPYAQNADTSVLNPASGLPANFNYIRNSVKIVVNAYSGKVTYYVMDPTDPIIETWEKAFPGMFVSESQMPSDLKAHLRYPEDMFAVQAQMYGHYHITNATAFYNAGDAWTLSQDPGSGSPTAVNEVTTVNAQGEIVSTGVTQRMAPFYEVLQVPGQSSQSFVIMDAYVPVSTGGQIQTLSGFVVGGSDPGQYGKLTVFETPRGQDIDGPALIDGRIQENSTVSSKISLLDRAGSNVLLGDVLMVPIDQSMLYFRPLYVQATRNAVPELQDVIAVASGPNGDSQVAMETTLQAALGDLFPGIVLPSSSASSSTSSTSPATGGSSALAIQLGQDLQAINTEYQAAQTALKSGNFSTYGTDISQLGSNLQQYVKADQAASATTTTTVPVSKPTTTVAKSSSTKTTSKTTSSTSGSATSSTVATSSTSTGEAVAKPKVSSTASKS